MATKIRNYRRKRKSIAPRRRSKTKPKSKAKLSQTKKRTRQKIKIIDLADPRDRAVERIKHGETQKAAAAAEGVRVKSLRNFMRENTRSKWVNGKWDIKDRRAVQMFIFESGQVRSIPVGRKAASAIGRYWNAVNQFLETNDISHLKPYRGVSLRDVFGKRHVFETDPNILRRGDSIGDLSFHTLYRNTVV